MVKKTKVYTIQREKVFKDYIYCGYGPSKSRKNRWCDNQFDVMVYRVKSNCISNIEKMSEVTDFIYELYMLEYENEYNAVNNIDGKVVLIVKTKKKVSDRI